MRKSIFGITLVLLLAGCSSVSPSVSSPVATNVPNTASGSVVPTASPVPGLRTYSNPTYHFSLNIPDETFSLSCGGSKPVEVRETEGRVEIGNRWSCEGTDPNSLRGWTIYASNGIGDGEDADAFVKKAIGPGCKVTGWDSTDGTFIQALRGEDATIEEISDGCSFIMSKYRLFYSERHKTFVFWSLTQEPQFVMEDKRFDYDDAILESFKFN